MAEYTYKDVIIDPNDPRVEVGKEYYWSDYPSSLLMDVQDGSKKPSPLLRVVSGSEHPFKNKDAGYQCIIRKKEPEKKWVPFDLTKEEDRARLRGAWLRLKEHSNEVMVKAIYPFFGRVSIDNEEVITEFLLENYEFVDGLPCGKLVEQMDSK